MIKRFKYVSSILFLLFIANTSCNKAPTSNETLAEFSTIEKEVLEDFTNKLAIATYLQLSVDANNLQSALTNLNNNTTDSSLAESKKAWLALREVWEHCEGFLFGPIEDFDFDPNMDTWPTDYGQLDSLIASSNALKVNNIQNLTLSLRGFHPLEYILFGNHGSKKAAEITQKQKQYMLSLSADIANSCNALYLSWTSAPTLFSNQLIYAGTSSSRYTTRKDAFITIVSGMINICDEVANGKMKDPFDAKDAQTVESPYSGNSLADFKNNIIGLQKVYLGVNGGRGIRDLVAAKNKSLDILITNQIIAAINSFSNITDYYEVAIFTQRVQVQQTMQTLNTLHQTIENQLLPFIQQQIKD